MIRVSASIINETIVKIGNNHNGFGSALNQVNQQTETILCIHVSNILNMLIMSYLFGIIS
jgi:hypothetical protein